MCGGRIASPRTVNGVPELKPLSQARIFNQVPGGLWSRPVMHAGVTVRAASPSPHAVVR